MGQGDIRNEAPSQSATDAAGSAVALALGSYRKRDGTTLTYSYDSLNRVTLKVVPEISGLAATHTRDVYYAYDLRGLQTQVQFDSLGGEGDTIAYDGFGRIGSASETMDGQTRQLSYLYDADGNRTRIMHPDAEYFTYSYDGLDRLNGIANSAAQTLVLPSCNSRGLIAASARYTTAHDQSFTYDPAGRLSVLGISGGNVTTTVVSWTFTRNPANQLISQTRDNDSYAWAGAVTATRSYATNGRNQYINAGSAAFCYDANANLTADGSSVYKYDVENRLVEKRAQGTGNSNCATLSYTGALQGSLRYDPVGRLHEVTSSTGVVTRFLYDGDALVGEYNSSGVMQRRFAHGADATGDDPLLWFETPSTTFSTARHLYADPRGSIVLVGDPKGGSYGTNTYDEYGIPGAANKGRFQYTGQSWLAEIGMYYYKARIYSPTLGRFLQTDPIGYNDRYNLYAYVGNDPINGTDPTGERCVIANSSSVYCERRDVYLEYDREVSGQTRFFGAAAATVGYLASNDLPIIGNVLSDRAENFLKNVSANLAQLNAQEFRAIRNGIISGGNLDKYLVHTEQSHVQAMLDALPKSDRSAIVSSINSAFNSAILKGIAGLGNTTDSRYNRVLERVIKQLGRPIDFARQGDREAIGNALIKDLRDSGDCLITGSWISRC